MSVGGSVEAFDFCCALEAVSERGKPSWMIPFFPQEDFGRLAVRGLLAALVTFRNAFCQLGR